MINEYMIKQGKKISIKAFVQLFCILFLIGLVGTNIAVGAPECLNTYETKPDFLFFSEMPRLLVADTMKTTGNAHKKNGVDTDQRQKKSSSSVQQGQKRVYLLHADVLNYDEWKHPGAQILTGNVRFRHEDTFMDCDSACYYEAINAFDAYGNVHMYQGDTLILIGDTLFYDGLTSVARMRSNVVLTHRESQLFTDSLDYDRVYSLGYFFDGGTLVDKDNILQSDWGEYSPKTKEAIFNFNVELTNPNFVLRSDTLHYNTDSKKARIVGPSTIDSEDKHIYSEWGVYDTQTEEANLLHRSLLYTDDGKTMVGDSLYYDGTREIGKAYRNVVYNDSVSKNMFTGHYCLYNDSLGYSEAADSAVAIDYSQKDTLYVHADTFKVFTYNMNTDSVYRMVHGYHRIRSYRTDVQAVCDSMVYSTKDSCLTLYKDPIIWNAAQQLLGEIVHVFFNDSTIDSVQILYQTLSVERIDSVHYNQVAGREIHSYFKNGELDNTWVVGDVEANYFPFDDDSLMIGMNNTLTSELKLFMQERKLNKIWTPAATGTMYPLPMIPADKRYLKNFAWFDYIRPLNKDDIFNWRPKKAGTELKASYKFQVPLQTLDQVKMKLKEEE